MKPLHLVIYERSPAQRLFVKGLRYLVSPTLVIDPRRPYCDDPVASVLWQRGGHGFRSVQVERWLPCRRCERCLLFKALRWRDRILVEIAAAPRSWYQTLTFNDGQLMMIELGATKLIPLDATEEARYRAVEQLAHVHVRRYLARLRKHGIAFRYFAVFEKAPETGRLHCHMVLHERNRPLLSRLLEGEWPAISYPRLVREDVPGKGASYLTKYLTKSAAQRVRASTGYGSGEPPGSCRASGAAKRPQKNDAPTTTLGRGGPGEKPAKVSPPACFGVGEPNLSVSGGPSGG